MIERDLQIPGDNGVEMATFVCHPDRGGPFPVAIFFMDAPGIREELRDMARRLASCGYYVMLPNLYYRSGVLELGPLPTGDEDPAWDRMIGLMRSLTIPMVMRDAAALLSHAAADADAADGPVGCVGYCMSGQYAINAAANFPQRIAAAASFYGTRLVTDDADSPHRVVSQAAAEIYVGCAEIDRFAPLDVVETFAKALAAATRRSEVEIYPGVEHGFAFPERPQYDRAAADRHWERLIALFRRNLG